MKRSLDFTSMFGIHRTEPVLQVTNYKRKSDFGFPLQILQRITISRADITTMEQLHGSLRAARSRNGKRRVPSCGSTANVRVHLPPNHPCSHSGLVHGLIAGAGKSVLW
jgi:hypothetical protein